MNLDTLMALRAAIQAFNADTKIQPRYAGLSAELDLLLSYIDIVERRCREESNI